MSRASADADRSVQAAALARDRLATTVPGLSPVVLSGRASVARSVLGRLWGARIDRLAPSRAGGHRARRLVRHDAVLHLRMRSGAIAATVLEGTPHTVQVRLVPPSEAARQQVRAAVAGPRSAVLELLAGRLSEPLAWALAEPACELLPRAGVWSATCTCPAVRSPCVHVLAALYAVGARLDDRPQALLRLHGIDLTALVPEPDTALQDDVLEAIFGIAIEPEVPVSAPPVAPAAPQAEAPLLPAVHAARTVSPTARPRPVRAGLVDSVMVGLVVALHGARCTDTARTAMPRIERLLRGMLPSSPPPLGALERLLVHLPPETTAALLRGFVRTTLVSAAPREALRRRIDRGRRSPDPRVPDVQLQPAPDGGLALVGPGAAAFLHHHVPGWPAGSSVLAPRDVDPEAVFAPFVSVAASMLAHHGIEGPPAQRRWRLGAGRTAAGLKSLLQASATQNE